MLKLEHEALAEEGCDCWTFMEACGTALQAWPLKAHGVLMYPLQLLTGNVPLAALLATTLQLATMGRELPSTASPLTVSRMPAPPIGIKWWCHSSDQEVMMLTPEKEEATGLDITPKEHPHQRWKEGRPLVRVLKESHWEAFRKDSSLIQATRWAYFKMHCPDYNHEGSQRPLPHLPGGGHLHWPHGLWSPPGPGCVDWTKGPLGCSPHGKRFPKGHLIFLGGASHKIT